MGPPAGGRVQQVFARLYNWLARMLECWGLNREVLDVSSQVLPERGPQRRHRVGPHNLCCSSGEFVRTKDRHTLV